MALIDPPQAVQDFSHQFGILSTRDLIFLSKQEIEEHLSSEGTDALDQFKGQMGQKHLGPKQLCASNKEGEDPR